MSFFFICSGDHPDLHSFPTRRSSDLRPRRHRHGPHRPLPLVRRGDHVLAAARDPARGDRKSTRLNSSHVSISYAVFCLKKKNMTTAAPLYLAQLVTIV